MQLLIYPIPEKLLKGNTTRSKCKKNEGNIYAPTMYTRTVDTKYENRGIVIFYNISTYTIYSRQSRCTCTYMASSYIYIYI